MDSDASRLEKLLNQCKNNDVDVKVDALTKLQTEFESGIEIKDPEGLLNILKTCLRTSNQHLTAATLASLPPLLPLLVLRSVNHAQPPGNHHRSPSSSTSSVHSSGVTDAATLRQVFNAFLPSGGVIDRLGDKEKAQSNARETLVILGGLAFRTGGSSIISSKSRDKGPETPMMIFERYIREGGLGSKVWKVREQSVLTLVHIRRTHHQFPIRPYLPLLVDCLEDTDAHVRECTRQAIVELFTGPGVTDGARADLKKEMSKKGVRKTIVDSVLSKILGGVNSNPQSHEGSENGDTLGSKSKEYVPPSLALQGRRPTVSSQGGGISRTTSYGSVKDISRPSSRAAMASSSTVPTPTTEAVEIHPVYIASSRDMENEFAAMFKPFEVFAHQLPISINAVNIDVILQGKETEHNWAAREQAILRVRGMLKGDVHLRYMDTFLASLKEGFIQGSLKTLASLRTTVSANTACMYSEMAATLGTSIDPFCETLLTNLLKMAGFTKKIAAQQSQASVTSIITYTSAQPRVVLPLLWNTLQEKTIQSRAFVVAHLKQYIEVHGHRSKNFIEASGGLETLEKSLKKALSDANPTVRENARILFWTFEGVWPDRGLVILETLDPLARKQVEKACPKPELVAALVPVTPQNTKKTSVAAAIAASRAKAKAIATAPPSLRHQATSGSHAPPTRRAGSPGISPRALATRPTSPLRLSSSPPAPPRSRTTSGGMARSVSTPGVPPPHFRTPSGGANGANPVVSPSTPEQTSSRKRTSSPLSSTSPPANKPSPVRKAHHTTLTTPTSPPSVSRAFMTQHTERHAHNTAVPPSAYHLGLSLQVKDEADQSLLLAQTVPIPDYDSDSDGDQSVNLMYEIYPPITPRTASKAQPLSHISNGSKPTEDVLNTLSSDSIADIAGNQPVVEDALRARAEQAESAAERLLELVESDEEETPHPSIPASLLLGTSNGRITSKTKPLSLPIPQADLINPVTPINRAATIMRQAAMFKNSPINNGHTSLMDVLQDKRYETGWWLKRKTLVAQALSLKEPNPPNKRQELQEHILALVDGKVNTGVLKKLTLLCLENPIADSSSPPPSPGVELPSSPSPFKTPSDSLPALHADIWDADKNFERLFNALVQFLKPDKSEEELEYGLILLWEMLENQRVYLEGRESDLFSVLLQVRYSNKPNVLEATNTLRDALTASIEPVYGLTTMHANLRSFHAEPHPASSDENVKAAAYAFGLIALGKFILRLPAEVAEEELPRLKGTLISSLNDKSSLIVRESAAASIIAAQLVLRDETHLFALLDGLADEKKNLLTYLFDKHGARGLVATTGPSGMDKLEKEIRRLDTRTSTPSRPMTSESLTLV